MDGLLAAVEGSSVATALRFSRWGYAAVNAGHIFGIALLIGAIVPLDLKLLGLWPDIARANIARVLVPVAACGLVIAATAGMLMFSIRAGEYADLRIFQLKLVLIATGAASALALHIAHGLWLETASPRRLAAAGALSLACWLGALVCGRMIAFAAG